MKKKYINPSMEIVKLEARKMIAGSLDPGAGTGSGHEAVRGDDRIVLRRVADGRAGGVQPAAVVVADRTQAQSRRVRRQSVGRGGQRRFPRADLHRARDRVDSRSEDHTRADRRTRGTS